MYKTEEELVESDLHGSAFHEAGHAIVCNHLGGYGLPYVWRNFEQNKPREIRAWRGTFLMYSPPSTILTRVDAGNYPLIARSRILVGLAGIVAEVIAQGETDPDDIFESIDDSIFSDQMSGTDLAMMGTSWTYEDVVDVTTLLLRIWAEIALEATCIIEKRGTGAPRYLL